MGISTRCFTLELQILGQKITHMSSENVLSWHEKQITQLWKGRCWDISALPRRQAGDNAELYHRTGPGV